MPLGLSAIVYETTFTKVPIVKSPSPMVILSKLAVHISISSHYPPRNYRRKVIGNVLSDPLMEAQEKIFKRQVPTYSGTADNGRIRAESGRGRVQYKLSRTRQQRQTLSPPPPNPAGRHTGREGVSDMAQLAALGRPALVTGVWLCTKGSEYFINEILNDLICDILLDRIGPERPPPPDQGWPGSEGGGAGYGAVTAPSRPALMTRSGLCTQNWEHFRNEMADKSTNL